MQRKSGAQPTDPLMLRTAPMHSQSVMELGNNMAVKVKLSK